MPESLQLVACGELTRSDSRVLHSEGTQQYFLLLCAVRSIFRINGRQYYMQPFTFLMHPFENGCIRAEPHGMTACRYMQLRISDSYLQYLVSSGLTLKETHTIARPLVVEEIWKLLTEPAEDAVPVRQEMEHYALGLLFCLLREASDGTVTRAALVPHYDKLTALRRRIYLHPEDNWFIQDICEELDISRPYFHKIYMEAFGISCTQDVIASRITCAKRLLETTEDPIAVISQKCGFETDVYFMRQFKRHAGITPTAYRRIFRHSAQQDEIQKQEEII